MQRLLTVIPYLLLIGIVVFNIAAAIQLNGIFTYPLDDAYIHMSISRSLMQHGIWGVTPFEFTSTSSSILYTLLLAGCFKLFGIKLMIPFIINVAAALVFIYWHSYILKQFLASWYLFLANVAMVLLVPLAGMCVLGMEHILQIGFCTGFVWYTYALLSGKQKSLRVYFLIAAICVLTRYESLFLIGITAGVWLIFYKRWSVAIGLLFFMLLPVVLFGLYSIANGGFFLPNSLLAKSQLGSSGVTGFIKMFSSKLLFNSLPAALLLFPFTYWLLFPIKDFLEIRYKPLHVCWLIIGITIISHVGLANLGWMFRYEAYLLALAFFMLSLSLPQIVPLLRSYSLWWRISMGLFVAFICFSIISRVSIITFTHKAINNIHDQQWQMGSFVSKFFPNTTIAVGDIGAVSFLNPSAKIMDLEGLASNEILMNKNRLDSPFLKSYAIRNKATIGLFYTHLYTGKIPASWELLGSWKLTNNFVGAGAEVGIFAIDRQSRDTILHALKRYNPQLPATVVSQGQFLLNRQ